MSDIVEKLRAPLGVMQCGERDMPDGSRQRFWLVALDAADTITALRAEVDDLGNRLHHVHRLWANNEHALRAENERLRTALEAIRMMDISWVGDAFKLKDIACAALEEKP